MTIGRRRRNLSENLNSNVCRDQRCQISGCSQTSQGQWPIGYGVIKKASRLEEAVRALGQFDEVILRVLLERCERDVQILEREKK